MRNSTRLKNLRASKALEDNNSETTSDIAQMLEGEEDQDCLEYDILAAAQSADLEATEQQTVVEVQDALEMYAGEIRHLIATESCTEQTLRLIKVSVNDQLARLNAAPEDMVVMESISTMSIVEQHVALEGFLRNMHNEWAQHTVMSYKHLFNSVGDFFRSADSQIKKYEGKLKAVENEFNTKKSGWKEQEHQGSLTEMWYHFYNDKGETRDIMGAVGGDLAMSSYALKEYPEQLLGLAEKAIGAIKSAGEDEAKLKAAFEAFPHPADLFKSELLDKTYLSKVTLQMDAGKASNGGDKLAALAAPKKVIESGSASFAAKKAGASLVGGAGGQSIKMTTEQIGQLIKAGQAYLENVRHYDALSARYKTVSESYMGVLEHVKDNATLKMVDKYMTNILLNCFNSPARAEAARSVKGAKYSMYLALRMIYNAK